MASALNSGANGPETLCCVLTVPLSTQVYKWIPVNYCGNLTNCGGVTCDELASRPGEIERLLAASRYGNGIRSGSYEPVLAPRLHIVNTVVTKSMRCTVGRLGVMPLNIQSCILIGCVFWHVINGYIWYWGLHVHSRVRW